MFELKKNQYCLLTSHLKFILKKHMIKNKTHIAVTDHSPAQNILDSLEFTRCCTSPCWKRELIKSLSPWWINSMITHTHTVYYM